MVKRLRRLLIYAFALVVVLWSVLPVVWLFILSITPARELLDRPQPLFPARPTLDSYASALFGAGSAASTARHIRAGLSNSLQVGVTVSLIGLAVGTLAGYAYARFNRYPFMRGTLQALLLTRMIPGLAIVIPWFIMLRAAGLLDSKTALVLTNLSFVLPLVVWMMKGYFETIPASLEQAAWVDGCSRLQAFVRVLLPVALPGFAAAGIFVFLLTWNEFLFAVMLTGTENAQTMPVVILGLGHSQVGLAVSMLGILPPVLVTLLLQKYLIQGLLSGSVRG